MSQALLMLRKMGFVYVLVNKVSSHWWKKCQIHKHGEFQIYSFNREKKRRKIYQQRHVLWERFGKCWRFKSHPPIPSLWGLVSKFIALPTIKGTLLSHRRALKNLKCKEKIISATMVSGEIFRRKICSTKDGGWSSSGNLWLWKNTGTRGLWSCPWGCRGPLNGQKMAGWKLHYQVTWTKVELRKKCETRTRHMSWASVWDA